MKQDNIDEILSRGVTNFVDPESLFKDKLLKKTEGKYNKDIVIKHGVDPTRPDIHLGHAVILRKLRQFQDLGCKVVFLVGDFTARIGDPSGRTKVRPEIEQAEVEKNAATYIEQVGKILRTDPKVFSWIRNSDWFTNITDLNLPDDYQIDMDVAIDGRMARVKVPPNSFIGKAVTFERTRMQVRNLNLKDRISVITLLNLLWSLRSITHSRLIERDMFQKRIKSGEELYMHEMMYPVLQGIDSFVISQIYGSCDLEIGGSDQTFNMLMGRDVMRSNNAEAQAVLSLELLVGLDGKEKMSKSLDNYVAITDSPGEIFGKLMSIPDSAISTFFKLATYTPSEEIADLEKKMVDGKVNPRDIKAKLAHEVVAMYHGEKLAGEAEDNFIKTFSNKGAPEELEVVKISRDTKLSEVLMNRGLVKSKTEWRRLVDEGAIQNVETGEKIDSPEILVSENLTVRVGKHRFLRLEVD